MEKVKQVWALAKANPKDICRYCGSNCCYLFFSQLRIL